MSRPSTVPTDASPFIITFDAADLDLSSTDANQAPMEMPVGMLDHQDFLVVSTARDESNASVTTEGTLQLVLVDASIHADTAGTSPRDQDPTPIAVVEQTIVAAIGEKNQHFDNGDTTGQVLRPIIRFDIRGVTSDRHHFKWFLCCSSLGDATDVIAIVKMWTQKDAPS